MIGIEKILKKPEIDNKKHHEDQGYDFFYRFEAGLWQGYKKVTEAGKPY